MMPKWIWSTPACTMSGISSGVRIRYRGRGLEHGPDEQQHDIDDQQQQPRVQLKARDRVDELQSESRSS